MWHQWLAFSNASNAAKISGIILDRNQAGVRNGYEKQKDPHD
jgi:hypothetical protein